MIKRPAFVLGVILALAALSITQASHGLTFYYDEWDFIIRRRGISADSLLGPHNGHLSLIPVLFYKTLLATIGLSHYWVYKLGGLIAHLLAATFVYLQAQRRIGPWWALVPATLVAFLGAAWEDLVWAFQIGFVGSIAAGLVMLWALDRDTRRSDLIAAAALLVALACSSQGIPFVVVALAELAVQRQWARIARTLVAPVGLYAVWYLAYGEGDLRWSNLDAVPAYSFQMLSAAGEGVVGLTGAGAGPVVAALAVIALLAAAVRGAWTARASGLLAGLAALLALTALARAQYGEPDASRYIYPVAVFGLLLLVELLASRVTVTGPTQRAAAVVAAALLVVALGGRHQLVAGAGGLRGNQQTVSAELAALRLIHGAIPPDYQPDPNLAPQLTVGGYLGAAKDFGTEQASADGLRRLSPSRRAAADGLLLRVRGPQASPVKVPAPGASRCRVIAAGAVLPLPDRGLTIATPKGRVAQVRYRRFADTFADQPATSVGAGASVVTPGIDGIAVPWQIRVDGADGVRVCVS